MKIDYRTLANLHIRNLTPYQPGKPIEELEREYGITSSIKLASNENPLGPSPQVVAAAKNILPMSHIYPDGACFELKTALANFLKISSQQITVGNGSENILELIVKAFLHKNNSAIISEFAFLTIPILLTSYGTNIQLIPAKNWYHDIDATIQAINTNTQIIFLVNPNNPTGTYTSTLEFEKLMQAVPPNVLVVVDEAYSEYIDQSDYPHTLNYLSQYANLIVTRTFSKVYGLAALRLGYAVSSPEIADILNRVRLPFNVNTIAAKAACIALEDQEHVNNSVALNNLGMDFFKAELSKLNLKFIPSLGNFITINVNDAGSVYQKLLQRGVIVRPLQAYNMPEYIRVTIGTAEQNQRFIAALKESLH